MDNPEYLNPNFQWDPREHSLDNYTDRSIYQSNVLEFWAPITDLVVPNIQPGIYWVSSYGRIWNSRSNTVSFGVPNKDNALHYQCYTTLPNPNKNRRGNKVVNIKVHVVVMKTFCYFPDCDNYFVKHLDGNKHNNNLYNLAWMSYSDKNINSIIHTGKAFKKEVKYILSDEEVRTIYETYKATKKLPALIQYDMGLTDKVSLGTIQAICYGNARATKFKNK